MFDRSFVREEVDYTIWFNTKYFHALRSYSRGKPRAIKPDFRINGKKSRLCRALMMVVLFCAGGFAFAQTSLTVPDPADLIGITLAEMINRYGVPKQVYAVRGVAAWQDDVVFVYDAGEFYIFGNRVWQLKLRSAYSIKDGDNKAAVARTLGEGRNVENYTLFQLPSRIWPLMLRVNWDNSGRAAGIYVYRSDF